MAFRFALIAALALLGATAVLGQGGSTALLSQLTWFDRSGRALGTVGPFASHGNVELSPDGRQVAVAVLDANRGTRDLWIYDVSGDGQRRLTDTPADENWAVWSRDGRTITFNSTRNGSLDLFQVAPDGRMPALLLRDGMWPVSWAPDGRHILFVINSPQLGNDVMVLPLFGDRQPYPFAQTPVAENWATFSPDGRWVAFSSTESGRSEVYVAAFPPTPAGLAARQQVSQNGGSQARWSRDGKEIFYIAQDRSLMVSGVDGAGARLTVGDPRRLFAPRFFFLDSHAFDVAADGQRILVNHLVVSPQNPTSVARR